MKLLRRVSGLTPSEEVAEALLAAIVAASRARRGELVLNQPAPSGWTRVGSPKGAWINPVHLPLGTFDRDLGTIRLDFPIPTGDGRLRDLLWTGALVLELVLDREDERAADALEQEHVQAREIQGRIVRTASATLADGLDETRGLLVSLRHRLAGLRAAERGHELETLHGKLMELERTVLEHLETIRAGTDPVPPLSGHDRTRYDDQQEVS